MNLEAIKTAATSSVARQALVVKQHSPTILFAGGVVGVVATTVLASRATLKLEEVLGEAAEKKELINTVENEQYTDEDRKRDQLVLMGITARKITKLYAPAAAVGVLSIAALTGSHVILSKRNAAVMAAYSALDRGFREYRGRVVDEYGSDKDREFLYGAKTESVERVEQEDGSAVEYHESPHRVPSIYARFFDEHSGYWSRDPSNNMLFLNCQQSYANDKLRARGHLFLNEVYDMLGLPRTKAGAIVGWVISKDGDNFVDFNIYDEQRQAARAFVNGLERSILLDFNVDGVIYDLLEE